MNAQNITITSSAPSGAFLGGPTFLPTATATSGLSVTFSIGSSSSLICSLGAGNIVSFIGSGPCVINANQNGNSVFNAAPQQSLSFFVGKGNQVVNFTSVAPSNAVVVGAPYIVSATSSAGLSVSFSVPAVASSFCSVSGSTVTFQASGTCVVQADQEGSSNYNAATSISQSFAGRTRIFFFFKKKKC